MKDSHVGHASLEYVMNRQAALPVRSTRPKASIIIIIIMTVRSNNYHFPRAVQSGGTEHLCTISAHGAPMRDRKGCHSDMTLGDVLFLHRRPSD